MQPHDATHGRHGTAGGADVGKSPVRDPVCGMTVDPEGAAAAVEHAGTRYYFCSAGCADSRFGGRVGLRYTARRHGTPRVGGRSCCPPRCRPSKWVTAARTPRPVISTAHPPTTARTRTDLRQ
ncbi:MAG TPA: YHS domain-containing protein [Gemmatimonadales bacterium]